MSESQTPSEMPISMTDDELIEYYRSELAATRIQLDNANQRSEHFCKLATERWSDLEATRARLAELEGIEERLGRAVAVSLKAMETAYERSSGMLRGFMGGKIDEVKAILAYKEGKK